MPDEWPTGEVVGTGNQILDGEIHNLYMVKLDEQFCGYVDNPAKVRNYITIVAVDDDSLMEID